MPFPGIYPLLILPVDFDIHSELFWLTSTPNHQSHEVGKRCVSPRNKYVDPRRAIDRSVLSQNALQPSEALLVKFPYPDVPETDRLAGVAVRL